MKFLSNLLSKKYGELGFGLTFGCSFFVIALRIIVSNTYRGGLLLSLFVAPIIICVPALFFIKSVRKWKEEENNRAINTMLIFILIVLLMALLLLADYILNGIV